MDLAFRTIQPPMQTRAPVRIRRKRGKRGGRLSVSSSATQNTSATSNTQLVTLMFSDVVGRHAQGEKAKAAKKIQREALRKMLEITGYFRKQKFHQPIISRSSGVLCSASLAKEHYV